MQTVVLRNHWALFPNAPWSWFPSVFHDLQGVLFMYSIGKPDVVEIDGPIEH